MEGSKWELVWVLSFTAGKVEVEKGWDTFRTSTFISFS
jgi:hypothetical protein